ncbi:MAG: hypothetical protein IAE94_10755 [Chthoniobacterales bacterium]|nr:hypothetical protein [Chthoniobacterales bacterium]
MKKQAHPSKSAMAIHGPWIVLLAVVAWLPMARELFSTTEVLSDRQTDVTLHFLFSRAFGFGEMAHGNLPLWNPYIYSGIPYLGQFQSALLYPPNLIFLILPLATAINWSFGLHIFLLGVGMYVWATLRGLKPGAGFMAGVAGMFSGTVMLHIYAGHLSNVCSMAWIPFLFAGIDRWLIRRHAGWLILSAGAVAMQVYAGHPQYVYFTALMAGLYSLVHLIGMPRPLWAALGLAGIYPLAVLLAAAQLLPGIAATSEAVRGGGVAYEFSAMFSFPPENLLTLGVPWFFGDMRSVPYWGRCYLWEMSFYVGVGMLFLAAFGCGRRQDHAGRVRLLILLVCAIVLALGAHTPLHKILFHVLPGFSSFRGSSKFILFAGLFIALFAGIGVDRLLRREAFPRTLAVGGALLGGLMMLSAAFVSGETIRQIAKDLFVTGECYFNPAAFDQEALLQAGQALAARSLQWSGLLCIGFSGCLFLANRWSRAASVACVAAVIELTIFARGTIAHFPLEAFTYKPVVDFLKQHSGDYRVLNLFNADASMMIRSGNLWGYDPGVLKRYAQLLHLSQGNDPETANQYLAFRSPHPILSMFRGRFAFVPKSDGQIEIAPLGDPFPRFKLYSSFRVLPEPKAVLAELRSPWFDLSREILLESEPIPPPEKEPPQAQIEVLDSSTDHWTLNIRTDRAAILVMTDSYSKDWRAIALPDSVQTNYTVQPANYAMRAIPLAAGQHHLRIEYVPKGFYEGVWLSLVSALAVIAAFIWKPLRDRLDFAAQ